MKKERKSLFFSNDEGLTDKLREALQSPGMRAAVARGGYERCQRESYDYSMAAKSIIEYFKQTSTGDSCFDERARVSELQAAGNIVDLASE